MGLFKTKKGSVIGQCRELGVRWWQCPQIVFALLGAFIAIALVVTNALANQYVDASVAFTVVTILSIIALIYLWIVVRAFELLLESRKREQDQTEEILALKDQFVFIAAHELRAPASAIKWALEEFEQHITKDENSDMLEILSRSSERLLDLVADLLSVARMESKTITAHIKDITLIDPLEESIEIVRPLATERNVSFDIQGLTPTMHVDADRDRLKEIFENLLSNAVKYSNQGGAVVIKCLRAEGFVLVSFIDTGIGISQEERKHVFEKFWRSKEARKTDGTGLGLFIVRELANLMHAEITFESKVGKGSSFTIKIPVGTGKVEDVTPQKKRERAEPPTVGEVVRKATGPSERELAERDLAEGETVVKEEKGKHGKPLEE